MNLKKKLKSKTYYNFVVVVVFLENTSKIQPNQFHTQSVQFESDKVGQQVIIFIKYIS